MTSGFCRRDSQILDRLWRKTLAFEEDIGTQQGLVGLHSPMVKWMRLVLCNDHAPETSLAIHQTMNVSEGEGGCAWV